MSARMAVAVSLAGLATVGLAATAQSASYPAWQPDTYYAAGTLVSYNGGVYRASVNQTDYSSTGWNPTTTSLWSPVGPGAGGSSSPTPTPTPTPTPSTSSTPSPTPSGACTDTWVSGQPYVQGNTVIWHDVNYRANWWTTADPSANNGGPGTGQPWTSTGTCVSTPSPSGTPSPTGSPTPTNTPTPTSTPTPTPPPVSTPGFVFSPYKDTAINFDWNGNIISTSVTGARRPLLSVLPTKVAAVTWAFATGACGSETWGGVAGASVASANVNAWVAAGRKYIISTGGAAGSFTCTSDASFDAFIDRYNSSSLLGIDFDIEGGQSQADVNNLVQRVKAAQSKYPNLRFSFTVATLGGNVSPSLGYYGQEVMSAIKTYALTGYEINLMTMDYGSPTGGNCTVNSAGQCDMGASAVQSAVDLHNQYGVPYGQIEVTPMIGGNDTQNETFSLADAKTLADFARKVGLGGIHFWSLDRDTDCAPGAASPTCNTYGQSGTWGFTNAFAADLGL